MHTSSPERSIAKPKVKTEVLRLLDGVFPLLDAIEKEQAVHLASSLLIDSATVSSSSLSADRGLCEHILSMGRIDVNPDVKDRARFESSILQQAIPFTMDSDAIETTHSAIKSITHEHARVVLQQGKPCPSFLPVKEDISSNSFRFGSLSSLMGLSLIHI